VAIDGQTSQTLDPDGGSLELDDASGTLTSDDGALITFDGIDKIEW